MAGKELKIKVLYWNLWFHEEPLTSMEHIQSLKWKGSLDY